MNKENIIRLTIGSFIILSLAALMAFSSFGHEIYDPNIYHILENYEKYENTQVSFSGEVTFVNNPNNITVMSSEPPYPKVTLNPNNTELNLIKGDIIEVLGILDKPNHITAIKILKMESWTLNLVYIRSLPAVPFALYLFFKTYTFNRKTIRFERRKPRA